MTDLAYADGFTASPLFEDPGITRLPPGSRFDRFCDVLHYGNVEGSNGTFYIGSRDPDHPGMQGGHCGFWFRTGTTAVPHARDVVRFRADGPFAPTGLSHVDVSTLANGSPGTGNLQAQYATHFGGGGEIILSSDPGTIRPNTWHWLEFDWGIANPGHFAIGIDGQHWDSTGQHPTWAGGHQAVVSVELGPWINVGNGGDVNNWSEFDDFCIWYTSGPWHPPMAIGQMLPQQDGSLSQMSHVSRFDNVAPHHWNAIADEGDQSEYISYNGGEIDTFHVSPTFMNGGGIEGVNAFASIFAIDHNAGETYPGAAVNFVYRDANGNINFSFEYSYPLVNRRWNTLVIPVNPITGSEWTFAELNDPHTEFGILGAQQRDFGNPPTLSPLGIAGLGFQVIVRNPSMVAPIPMEVDQFNVTIYGKQTTIPVARAVTLEVMRQTQSSYFKKRAYIIG